VYTDTCRLEILPQSKAQLEPEQRISLELSIKDMYRLLNKSIDQQR